MVIPSYWTKSSYKRLNCGDEIYDHPTPLDQEGTLLRTLLSLNIFKVKNFQLVIIIAPTSNDFDQEVTEKVTKIVNLASLGIDTTIFGPIQLKRLHEILINSGKENFVDLLSLKGYSNIRNLCLFLPHLLNSDLAVLIDDDEVFEDADFTSKMLDYVGSKYNGKDINAIAGYYLQPDGHYNINKKVKPWMKYWGQYDRMNEAFDMIIGSKVRLKETPFVFGGNMVIHRNLFSKVPFDPQITRGEDIDYLINAKMFGFCFFLDNQLSIKHLPPPKTHPSWLQLRQDIYRFIYEKAKIDNQKRTKGMVKVYAEDFDPYPGFFLKENLKERIKATCQLLAQDYITQGNQLGSEEALNNISLAEAKTASIKDPFDKLCQLQKLWQRLMEYTDKKELRSEMLRAIKEESR
jgi:hypothetical protein